eukprot:7881273-Alexandrium_andersonii.AAC.1
MRRSAAAQRRGQKFLVVALVIKVEQRSDAFKDIYCRLTEPDALDFFTQLDARRSCRGWRGR